MSQAPSPSLGPEEPAPAPALEEERVPTSRIVIYASPLLGVFMGGMLINFYLLKFATDVLLLGPALMGSILLGARVWDAVTDPLVGWLSDRTRSRFGRRRPWFLASALPFAASLVMLWSPPESLGDAALGAWIAVAVLLFYTTYTTFRVPHMALGAELSRGYHDRTRVFGISQAIESVGMLSAAGVLVLLERADDPRSFARWLSVGIAIVGASSMIAATLSLRERSAFQGRGGTRPWRAFADVLRNPHSRLLIAIFLAEQLGFSALVVLLPYLSDYLLQTPGDTGLYLFGAIGAAFASIPVWVHLSRRFGKKPMWLMSVVIKMAAFAVSMTLGEGDGAIFLGVTIAFGFMHGCGSVVGPSLKADVVDWDEAQTGERKEGAYFATWNFAQKGAGGVSVWLVGMMLALTGFVPNAEQSPETLDGMRLLAGGLPLALHVVAVIFIARFSFGEEEHRAARERALERATQRSPEG
ncbi:MAG: MFS transporter [Myxococcota bacterium]|nr:MFS transporter [Myxococcota bacterium]